MLAFWWYPYKLLIASTKLIYCFLRVIEGGETNFSIRGVKDSHVPIKLRCTERHSISLLQPLVSYQFISLRTLFLAKESQNLYIYISGIMTSENLPHLQECNETFERVRSAFSCIASYLSKTSLPCTLRLIMLKYFLLHCWRCFLELWAIHTYVFWHLLLCGGGLCDYTN